MKQVVKEVDDKTDWVMCIDCRRTFHMDNMCSIGDVGDGKVVCSGCHDKRRDDDVLCIKCQKSYNMLDNIKYSEEGEPYCNSCYNTTEFNKFVINEFIDLRLIGDRTELFINGERFVQCMFLLINIPTMEAEDEKYVNIDEFQKKYSTEMEDSRERIIPPETEFWGHCSNIQAWVESKYNPNILHSNIAMPLLKELCRKDIHIFHSLLTHLDDMWDAYKTYNRKSLVMYSYKDIVSLCIHQYKISITDADSSVFLRALYHLKVCANMDIFIRDVYTYVNARDERIAKIILELAKYDNYWDKNAGRDGKGDSEWKLYQRRRNYWEKRIYGSNLQYRRWLRQLRDHNVSVVSDVEGYLPYIWSKGLGYWRKLSTERKSGHSVLHDAYTSEGIKYTYNLGWVYQFCNGWNGSHNLTRYAVRYKDGTIAIRHLVI